MLSGVETSHSKKQCINEPDILSNPNLFCIAKPERGTSVISTCLAARLALVEKSSLIKRLLFFVIIVMSLQSCSSSDTNKTDNALSEKSTLFPEFKNFPDQVFLQIKLGMNLEVTDQILQSNDYKSLYIDDSKYYLNESDSIELVFPESDELHEITIFIKNKRYLSKNDELRDFFSKKASKMDKNGNLSIMDYTESVQNFRLVYFVQSDYIRLKIVSI